MPDTVRDTSTATLPARRESPLVRQRTWALEHGVLTPRGAQDGYVVLKPSRALIRCWSELLALNSALTRLETNTLTLLGAGDAFVDAARDVVQQVKAWQGDTRRLARAIERLARGRLPDQAAEASATLADDGTLPTLDGDLAGCEGDLVTLDDTLEQS